MSSPTSGERDDAQPRTIYDPIADTPTSYLREARGAHPPLDYPPYKSTALRHPQAAARLPAADDHRDHRAAARRVRVLGELGQRPHASSTTASRSASGSPSRGRVFDTEGKPLRGTLVEIWQANAAGRYRHRWDRWPAPLDPNFTGAGRCVTDDEGRYQFTTIKPGPYPWGNHYNAWRPAHIHFSLLGRAFAQRLVTQMYFPGDPLFPYDPIFNSVRDERGARADGLALLDPRDASPNWALAFEWDIYLRGPGATPFEEAH